MPNPGGAHRRARALAASALSPLFFLAAGALAKPALEAEPAPGIRIKGTAAFRQRARESVSAISKTACGALMLKELGASKRRVVIREGSQEHTGALMTPLGGGDSVILWDPEFALPNFPPLVFLYHELVHSLHEARKDALPYREEERRVLGIAPYADYPLSENALRRELKLPARKGNGWEEFPEQAPDRGR